VIHNTKQLHLQGTLAFLSDILLNPNKLTSKQVMTTHQQKLQQQGEE
jgi:hypothetical protein